MPTTYEPIATTTLGSSASSISFSSIPSTYTDLKLIFVPLSAAGGNFNIQFNSDTDNYTFSYLIYSNTWYANIVGATSSIVGSPGNTNGLNGTYPNLYDMNINSYANTSIYKNCLFSFYEQHGPAGSVGSSGGYVIGTWNNTDAITSIQLTADWDSGTTATLYGIKKA